MNDEEKRPAMRRRAKSAVRTAAVLAAVVASAASWAGRPTCHLSNGTPYCNYVGKVQNAYVNSGNFILMYFDTPFASASEMNIPGVTVLSACAIAAGGKMDFAKMFYASMLMAQASGRNVTVHMYGNVSGYPGCDRIWTAD